MIALRGISLKILLLILLAALFTLRGKPLAVGAVSAVHAASYSIFFLVAMVPAVSFLLRRDRDSVRTLAASTIGLATGLLANPYFPENVRFDAVQVAILGIATDAAGYIYRE